eukprot:1678156-Prymnesium_polylepis.1
MDVVVRVRRGVVLDHVTHIGHVDAACGNVGRDEDTGGAVPETMQRPLTLRLAPVSVDHVDAARHTCTDQLGELVHCRLGGAEDERLRVRLRANRPEGLRLLLRLIRPDHPLLDGRAGRADTPDAHEYVAWPEKARRQPLNLLRERGAAHEAHARRRAPEGALDGPQLRLEAEIEHPVGLIDDE